jgi:3-oxoacyl-[acyl-carrier-protein] synthase-1
MSGSRERLGGTALALTGCELLTSVGNDAPESCASLRAGINRMGEYPLYYPTGSDPGWNDDQPLQAAPIRGLSPELSLRQRMVELAARVLRQLPSRHGLRRAMLTRTALLVALPLPDRAVKSAQIAEKLVPDLLHACALPPFPVTRVSAGGHTAAFQLLVDSQEILDKGEADTVVLLAVDSYFSSERLQLLDEEWRLKSARNVDGFVPGEAAAALLLQSASSKHPAQPSQAILHAPGFADEQNPTNSDRQSTGRALSGAIDKALAGAAPGPCPWVACDMNGESYRAYEWGLALSLLPDRLGHVTHLAHPADCIGDVGAATGALLIALACSGFLRGYAPSREALLWTASDARTRAALRIESATHTKLA